LPGVEFVGKTLGQVGELTQLGGRHDDHRRNEIAHFRESLANATERIPLTVSPTRLASRSSRMAMLDRLAETLVDVQRDLAREGFANCSRRAFSTTSDAETFFQRGIRSRIARESNRNPCRMTARKRLELNVRT
jgi:hypothetical protein